MNSDDSSNQRTNVPDYCQVLTITGPNGDEKEILLPRKLDLQRPKRSRTQFTSNQLDCLEDMFAKSHYLNSKQKKELSSKLKLSETQVKVWFQNRRTKHKRDQTKQKQEVDSKAETIATSNVLRILEEQRRHCIASLIESDSTVRQTPLHSMPMLCDRLHSQSFRL